MTPQPLYFLTVDDFARRQLIAVTGTRETVIECALRAILDSAPGAIGFDARRPTFTVNVQTFRP